MNNISSYALACGSVQSVIISEDDLFQVYGELYKEHNTYHVRAFKRVKHSSSSQRLVWESFDTVKEARKFLASLKKSID
jgi:hypothetical protein